MSKRSGGMAGRSELQRLRKRVRQAEETLRALRRGEVDAVAVEGREGRRVLVLDGAEKPYRILTESMIEGAASLALEGTILFCNGHLLNMVGRPSGKVIGRRLAEFVAPEDQDRWKQLLARARSGEAREEMRLRRHGELLPVLLSLKRYPVEQLEGLCLIAVDLSERDQAEEQARAASRYTRSLIESSLDPLVTISKDGKIMDVNAATEKATGKSRQGLIGTDFAEYFTDPGEARRGYTKVFESGSVRDYPLALRHGDGHITEVLYNASVYRDQEGEIQGVFAAARDVTERKQAEQALAAERKRFLNVLDLLPAYVILLTPDYHVAFSNRVFRERFGESGGRRCYEFLFQRDSPCEVCETYKVLKTGSPLQWKWTGPDGRHYDISDFPFPDADGSRLILEMGVDVTERERAQEEVQRQADLLHLAPVAVLVRDLESRITFWSRGAEELYGWRAEEVLGRVAHELLQTEFPAPLEAIEEQLGPGHVWEGELQHVRRDGQRLNVGSRWALQRDFAGAARGYLEINLDISERKRAEQELHRLNRALRALSRCTEAVARASEEQALLGAVCEIVVQEGGYPLAWVGYAEQDNDKTVRAVAVAGLGSDYVRNARITWADTERGRGPTGTAIRTGVPCYVPEITQDPRFTPWREEALHHGYASAMAIPLLESGRSFGALNIYAPEPHAFEGEEYALMLELAETLAHGIVALRTQQERDRAATALQELNTTLESRVAQRTAELAASTGEMESFTYSVSHDLRAPLRHIDGFSKVLLEQYAEKLDDVGRHYLERVREGTQRMGQLVDDLLNLSRLGRRELQVRPVALAAMAQEIIDELEPEAVGRRVEWRVGGLPQVRCDPGLMRQVLYNLLSNALKFTRGCEPAVIEVGARGAELYVRDNGVGFDPQYAGKLFGVFQRLHRSEDFPGTGVGLATVRRILRKHGGDIRAEAAVDAGATFYFTVGRRRRYG